MILPGRYMRRHRRPGHDYGEAFLYDLRFDDKAQPRADFVLNQPAYRDAKILVTDTDFGCGSSREGAAFAVMDFGLARAGRRRASARSSRSTASRTAFSRSRCRRRPSTISGGN